MGVIRNGEYVDPVTGKPISLKGKKIVHKQFNINTIGGIE